MAYERRISELQDLLKSVIPNPKDPGLRLLADCISRYAQIRSIALDELVELINKSTIGASGLQDLWRSRAQRAKDDLTRNFGDAVKDVLLAAPLQAFWAGALQFEGQFFDRLSAIQTPSFIENLLTHQGMLAQLIDKLQSVWSDLLTHDKDLENAQMDAVQELDLLIQALTSEIEKQNQSLIAETTLQLKEKMNEAAERVKQGIKDRVGEKAAKLATAAFKIAFEVLKDELLGIPDEVKPEIERQKEKVQVYVERLALFSQAYRERAETYRRLMSAEKGGVLTMFKATRDQIIEYEKNNNLVTAQIMRDEAKRFLTNWAGDTIAAQRDDAAQFNARLFDVIDKNWKVTEVMAKQFEDKFSGVFYAPLTSDTLETLTESYMFRKAIDSINSRGAAVVIEKSQQLLADSVDDTVEKVTQPLDTMSIDWSADLKDAAKLSKEEFRAYIRDKLKSQIDLALNSLGELRGLIDPPKVVADFTREELDAMLRS